MSRLRSNRGASRPTPARGGRPGVFVQTPQSDIYVALLGIALGAIVLGCLLLFLILNGYGFALKAASTAPTSGVALAHLSPQGPAPEVFSTVHL